MKLRELLYPPRCPFCGKVRRDGKPCEGCLASAAELTDTVCKVCGADLPNCFCRASRKFSFSRNVSAYLYAGAAKTLVLRFKMRERPQLAVFMAGRMAAQVRGRLNVPFTAVTFVPGTPLNTFRRGYSPARLLAEELARRLELPCTPALRRVRSTQQKYLSAAERRRNARESYRLLPVSFSGAVLLVDDLVTTGATLDVCASLLKKAGAGEVYTATFALAPKNS